MRRDSGRCVLIPDYNVYDYTITEDGEYSYVMGNINDCESWLWISRREYSAPEKNFSSILILILSIYRIARNF